MKVVKHFGGDAPYGIIPYIQTIFDKLSDENIEKFYEMGSLIQKNTNGMSVMKDVLMNKKIKLNF